MNASKAQEYFSLYFEGELEGGLREQFERTLRQDAQVQAEYRAFVRTMAELESLAAPVPEPDFDLHESIARKLDQHFYEVDRRKKAGFTAPIWRRALVGGIAAVALFGAAASLWNANQNVNSAGLGLPVSGPKQKPAIDARRLSLKLVEGVWTLSYTADGQQDVTIQSAIGANRRTARLGANDILTAPLINGAETTTVIEVVVSGVHGKALIALPGASAEASAGAGSGAFREFAAAIATKFQKPVVVLEKAATGEFSWSFEQIENVAALTKVVEKFQFAVEENADGVIWIQ